MKIKLFKAYNEYMGFISTLNDAVKNTTLHDECPQSEVAKILN
jgi:hypothetical protein